MFENALFENAFLFTVNGLVVLGNATTFEAYPASKATAKIVKHTNHLY